MLNALGERLDEWEWKKVERARRNLTKKCTKQSYSYKLQPRIKYGIVRSFMPLVLYVYLCVNGWIKCDKCSIEACILSTNKYVRCVCCVDGIGCGIFVLNEIDCSETELNTIVYVHISNPSGEWCQTPWPISKSFTHTHTHSYHMRFFLHS